MNEAELQRRLLATFRDEAREHWHVIATGLATLARGEEPPGSAALVETIFRDAHTLKGAARLVGELEVEAICERLEEAFADWKQRGVAPDAAALRHLQGEADALRRELGLDADDADPAAPPTPTVAPPREPIPTAPRPAEPSVPAPAPSPPAASAAASVLVPAARVESMLNRTEELLAAKAHTADQVDHLHDLGQALAAWRRERARLRPQFGALRRFLDETPQFALRRELASVLEFADRTDDTLTRLGADAARLERGATRHHGWLGAVVDGLLEEAKQILMLPCASLLEVFPGFVREAAAERGIEVDLVLEGADTEVDRRILKELREAVLHLVRNSLDHGLEPPDVRLRAGKPRQGRLRLTITERSGSRVEVVVADDGRGIRLDHVKRTAVERGLIERATAEALSDPEVISLLFASGFSTREAATTLSGRGLGLAIVREKVERLGGSVTVENRPGAGATFRLLLPITLARFRGLFVRAGGQLFALPAHAVQAVVRVRRGEVRDVKGQLTLTRAGETLPLVPLARLLRLPEAPAAGPDGRPTDGVALILGVEQLQVAVRVEEVPHETEMVVKPLGRLLRQVRQVIGATTLGPGQVVPVLNPNHLLVGLATRGAAPAITAPVARATTRHKILIVEDSITSRSLFRNILRGAGYEVRTAVDGIEAMTALTYEPADLVISDVQMPRMDGFELTRKLRADPTLATLPVILITSLATSEDRERGVDVGANAYIVKSSFDQSDLLRTVRRLLP